MRPFWHVARVLAILYALALAGCTTPAPTADGASEADAGAFVGLVRGISREQPDTTPCPYEVHVEAESGDRTLSFYVTERSLEAADQAMNETRLVKVTLTPGAACAPTGEVTFLE